MTKRKKAAATTPAVDGPAPDRGGAWIRQPDGSLVRDTDEDQHIPDDEKPGEEREPETGTPPPPVDDTTTTETQEG